MQERVKNGGPPLTRWETRFIKKCNQDILKWVSRQSRENVMGWSQVYIWRLIPFALIILIIEEIIPLVVIYAPFILPSTCVLPSQKERIDAKRRTKQFECVQLHKPVFEEVFQRSQAISTSSSSQLLENVSLEPFCGYVSAGVLLAFLVFWHYWHIWLVCSILSLSTIGPNSLRLRRIQRHLASIVEDDALLRKEGSGQRLSEAELQDALEERGM